MKEPKIVLIGIQARSSSTRLPNKAALEVAGKPILQHIVDACSSAAEYLNRNFRQFQALVRVAVLVPAGDPIAEKFRGQIKVLEYDVPENDVLSRYALAAREQKADLIVRITADCLFMAPYLVSRHVKAALIQRADYTSNVLLRTFMEGLDCEVLSRRLLEWLDAAAEDPYDREHVTTLVRKLRQAGGDLEPHEPHLTVCHVLDNIDLSHVKTSIDTKEDFDRAAEMFRSLHEKKEEARKHGALIG